MQEGPGSGKTVEQCEHQDASWIEIRPRDRKVKRRQAPGPLSWQQGNIRTVMNCVNYLGVSKSVCSDHLTPAYITGYDWSSSSVTFNRHHSKTPVLIAVAVLRSQIDLHKREREKIRITRAPGAQETPTARSLRRIATTPSHLLKFLLKIRHGEAPTTILTGHVLAEITRVHPETDPTCIHCSEEPQRVDHLLFSCPAFLRHRIQTAILLGLTHLNPRSMASLPDLTPVWKFLVNWFNSAIKTGRKLYLQTWSNNNKEGLAVDGRGGRRSKQHNVLEAPRDAGGGGVDEGPDVGNEELLRLVFLHVLELQLRELLDHNMDLTQPPSLKVTASGEGRDHSDGTLCTHSVEVGQEVATSRVVPHQLKGLFLVQQRVHQVRVLYQPAGQHGVEDLQHHPDYFLQDPGILDLTPHTPPNAIAIYSTAVLLLLSLVEIPRMLSEYRIDGFMTAIRNDILDLSGPLSLTAEKTDILPAWP
ncbi:hypothetical protein LAZ67_6002625 [Cordylochernes scorpioides]|uniref:Reverse transcriptase zinc-binding domain-containing protein n=1 Tax=Cordylochernes scorpioides TaxID=51811 RepID=A0ABY6KPX5_9ARAC|nr:hypothetical protein LAZ67_6002625 [Cordylochernes scorpioides]